jgi:hypothetical protein
MGRVIRTTKYLSEISSVRELREARTELELREWFARERLASDVYDTLTWDNLLSMVAPPGSLFDRVIGGVGTGLAATQGILGLFGSFFGGRTAARTAPRTVSRPVSRTTTRTVSRTVTRQPDTRTAHKRPAVTRAVAHKRTPEIEVEVELEPPRAPRVRKKA